MAYAVHTDTKIYAIENNPSDACAVARGNGLDTWTEEYTVSTVSEALANDWNERGDWNQYKIVDNKIVEEAANA